jgi:hypothetical protein
LILPKWRGISPFSFFELIFEPFWTRYCSAHKMMLQNHLKYTMMIKYKPLCYTQMKFPSILKKFPSSLPHEFEKILDILSKIFVKIWDHVGYIHSNQKHELTLSQIFTRQSNFSNSDIVSYFSLMLSREFKTFYLKNLFKYRIMWVIFIRS